jgi:hypothetical protein
VADTQIFYRPLGRAPARSSTQLTLPAACYFIAKYSLYWAYAILHFIIYPLTGSRAFFRRAYFNCGPNLTFRARLLTVLFSISNERYREEKMGKISGAEGCHSKTAVPRHGVFAMTGPRMLIFAYTSFHAFVVCGSLTSIDIPPSVGRIWIGAFEDYASLTSVTMSGRTDVAEDAFPDNVRIRYRD